MAGFSGFVITSYYTHKVLTHVCTGHRGPDQRSTSPQCTIFNKHPRMPSKILPVLFLPPFYLHPYFLKPHQDTEFPIKLLWALWLTSAVDGQSAGQGQSKEKEAEEGEKILDPGCCGVCFNPHHVQPVRTSPLGGMHSFLGQLHRPADIFWGSKLCVPILSLVFTFQCLGKKETA